jgi:hypothetical protein
MSGNQFTDTSALGNRTLTPITDTSEENSEETNVGESNKKFFKTFSRKPVGKNYFY